MYGIYHSGEIILLFPPSSVIFSIRSCIIRNRSCILTKDLRLYAIYTYRVVKLNFAFPCSGGNFGVLIIKTTYHGNNDH